MEAASSLSERAQRPRLWQRLDLKWAVFGFVVALVAWLSLVPLVFLLWQSFYTPQTATVNAEFTLGNYYAAYSSLETLRLLLNSMQFAAGAALFAFLVGTLLAWINERTNTPFKALFFGLPLIPLVIPSILFTVSGSCWRVPRSASSIWRCKAGSTPTPSSSISIR